MQRRLVRALKVIANLEEQNRTVRKERNDLAEVVWELRNSEKRTRRRKVHRAQERQATNANLLQKVLSPAKPSPSSSKSKTKAKS